MNNEEVVDPPFWVMFLSILALATVGIGFAYGLVQILQFFTGGI